MVKCEDPEQDYSLAQTRVNANCKVNTTKHTMVTCSITVMNSVNFTAL